VDDYLDGLPNGTYQGLFNPLVFSLPFLRPSSVRSSTNDLFSCRYDSAGRVRVFTCALEKVALIIDACVDTLCTQAYPDVSAQSRRFLIYYKGNPALISGTSAASQTFGAVVALLNDALLAAGKPPLGFLNPLLYGAGAEGLNDITQGNNPGCGTPGFNVGSLSHPFLVIQLC
jgi:hypothetical protein